MILTRIPGKINKKNTNLCLTNLATYAKMHLLPKTAGAAKRKSCRGAPDILIVCVSFCLLAGRHFLFFGGEKYAQRKGS
jgi:hypothetical protein